MNTEELLDILSERFDQYPDRHPKIFWIQVKNYLKNHPDIVATLIQMEETGGEPDIIQLSPEVPPFFADMSAETPVERRGVCYDEEARISRKKNPPVNSAQEIAEQMQARLMDEDTYRNLQNLEPLDQKTSSWLETPTTIREKGGAIFGDQRYGQAFIYHNGADSYFSTRGFRLILDLIDW